VPAPPPADLRQFHARSFVLGAVFGAVICLFLVYAMTAPPTASSAVPQTMEIESVEAPPPFIEDAVEPESKRLDSAPVPEPEDSGLIPDS